MDLIKIINDVCDAIIKNKEYLTGLDREIGDGDHGVNLARGFEKIKEQTSTYSNMKLNEVFSSIAMTLMSNVGGASGALYSSAFLQVSKYLKNIDNKIDKSNICQVLNEFVNSIKTRGNSTTNEKTMLDTLVPAFVTFEKEIKNNSDLSICLKKMEETAKQGMESTKDMIATKGRASYLKERSVGHIDPGSASSYLIIKTIVNDLVEDNVKW